MKDILRASRARPAVSLGLVLGALALPASAQARLSYQTCIAAPSETYTTCPSVASDNAIESPSQFALSPDGSTAYVTGTGPVTGGGNVGIFSTAGGLAQTGALPNDAAVTNYGPPTYAAVSPDGNNVYVAARDQLWTYTRSHVNGSLSSPSCAGAAITSCPTQAPELTDPYHVVFSPDGSSVYVIGDNALASPTYQTSLSEFSRDPVTGALTHLGCLDTASAGPCTEVPTSMLGLRQLFVSPDGRHAYGVAYSSGSNGAVILFSRDTTTGALTYDRCYGQSGGCIAVVPHSHIPLSVSISSDGTQLYVSYGDSVSFNNISTYSVAPATGGLTFAGCIANGLAMCASSSDQFYDNGQLLPSPDGRDLYVSDNGDGISEYARDPATGVLSYVGCYSYVGAVRQGPFFTSCTNTAPGLYYSQDMAISPNGSALYLPSWGNNPWSSGSLGNYGGGVVDEFSRVADVAASTPPPAILTSSTSLGRGSVTFGPLRHHRHHRARAMTITLKLSCPAGVTQYCSGSVKQVGNGATAITGLTDSRGRLTVHLRVHLGKRQLARLLRVGHVKITVVFVQHMPNGQLRRTRRTITIK